MLVQAIQLNTQGVHCLASGQVDDAVNCFRGAISLVARQNAEGFPPQDDLAVSQAHQSIRMIHQRCAHCGFHGREEKLFLINLPSPGKVVEASHEALSLYSAALIFNCAVAVELNCEARHAHSEFQGQDACQLKVFRLFDQLWRLIGTFVSGYGRMPFDHATMDTVVHKIAKTYYKQGQFESVRNLLNTLLQMDIASNLVLPENEPLTAEAA